MVRQLPGTAQWPNRWAVESLTDSDKWYTTSMRNGTWACSCAKWKFAKAPKADCHHIQEVKLLTDNGMANRQPMTGWDAEATRRRAAMMSNVPSPQLRETIRRKLAERKPAKAESVYSTRVRRAISLDED